MMDCYLSLIVMVRANQENDLDKILESVESTRVLHIDNDSRLSQQFSLLSAIRNWDAGLKRRRRGEQKVSA
jgi:hypothetical protein